MKLIVSIGMRDYVNIPDTMYVRRCKDCGARPVIAFAGETGYLVKCPDNNHYKTLPGLIDLEDWNRNNKITSSVEYPLTSMMSLYP